MQTPSTFPRYRPSGKWHAKIFAWVPSSLVLAAAAGALYQMIVMFDPIIYFNILISFGAAVIIGFGAMLVIQLSNCRNGAIGTLVGALTGLVALGASHYVSYRSFVNEFSHAVHSEVSKSSSLSTLSSENEAKLAKLLTPTFSAFVKARVETGWVIAYKNSPGKNLAGSFVYCAWLFELGVFLLIPMMMGLGTAVGTFCEKCQVWADHKVNIGHYPITDEQFLLELKQARSVGQLLGKPEVSQAKLLGARFALIYSIRVCPGCEKLAFLRIAAETKKFDKEGKEKKVETALVDDIPLSEAELETLLSIHRPSLPEQRV